MKRRSNYMTPTPSWEENILDYLTSGGPTHYSQNGQIFLHDDFKAFIAKVEAQAIRDTIEKVREGIDNLRGWNDCVQGPEHHGTCEVCAARQSHNSTLKEVHNLLSSLTPNDQMK